MKILLLGSSGMLGSQIFKYLSSSYDIYTLGRSTVIDSKNHVFIDVNNEIEFRKYLEEKHFDYIINSIAITDHKYCDRNIIECFKINSILNRIILEATPSKTAIIYISSDAVFSDEKLIRSPETYTSPQSIYGLSKELGERLLLMSNSKRKFLIIRTTIVGLSPKNNSFVDWMINNLEENKIITLFSDVYFNPISIYELSEFLIDKISNGIKGRDIIHISNKETCSKYQFGLKIISALDFDISLIKSGKMSSFLDKGDRCFNQVLEISKNQGISFTISSTINSIIKNYENKNKISQN